MDEEGVHSVSLPFQLGQWNTYEIDVTADAIQHFTLGGADTLRAEDNSLYEVRLGLEARGGAESIIYFDDYQIVSDETLDGDDMLGKIADFGALYETMYPTVSHFTGSEVSRFRAQPHMNAYLPSPALVDYTGQAPLDTLYYAVDQIHDQGGAISLNHMYGVGIYSNGTNETPQETAWRILATTRTLLATRAYGVDMLEVGYRIRSGVEMESYLSTWDALSGNAIFVTGNGVTDSHGSSFLHGWGPWQPGNYLFENNFVSWFFATELTETALIDAMVSGRAFFGDPYLIDSDGTLDLRTTEGFPMGRVVVTDRASHDLIVEVTGVPSSVDVRLLQGEIREDPPQEYIDVNYLRDELLSGTFAGNSFADTVTVDTTIPSFVRVEVSEGDPWAFSNPIFFVRNVPQAGIAGPRVAASLDDIRILDAEEFTLLDVSIDPTMVTVSGDEEPPGLGTLAIDTGPRGEPSGVVGATTWSFDAGVLNLSGFQGAGSVVHVLWGPVGVDLSDETVRDVSLGTGSPNPFGRGIVCEYALPHSGQVLLEILDVHGRRVRILLDERRASGVHRVSWDGKDPYGRPVADGVYFLRLRALGRTLTTKAVKIR
jgi:hypothetical protein